MLSIQDESLVPAPVSCKIRKSIPAVISFEIQQLSRFSAYVNSSRLGFHLHPSPTLKFYSVTKDGLEVAIKIQYPGVADSIESDIENVAKEELSRECNYELEAENQKKFRGLLVRTKEFYVPSVVDDLSSKKVLTTELVPAVSPSALVETVLKYVGNLMM
ncbi:hypothetical protein ACJIZ3_022302 [Penstemon smallii]|uniref:ABC1 atypical kinase-like domain-containing protein n=1 Tax=Penstemon smallii TaxID=265156 RepID=A0ABD3TKU3_9LAMI